MEDDITISKEKRHCSVHKGPFEGFSYICPECGSIYCAKCYKAIKRIENACWSCGIALDPSLPIKEEKKEKETEFQLKK